MLWEAEAESDADEKEDTLESVVKSSPLIARNPENACLCKELLPLNFAAQHKRLRFLL